LVQVAGDVFVERELSKRPVSGGTTDESQQNGNSAPGVSHRGLQGLHLGFERNVVPLSGAFDEVRRTTSTLAAALSQLTESTTPVLR
jgi:hypothetical protein